MSDSVPKRINVGAYDKPFSGVGIEYYPLGGEFDHTGLLIHEVGYSPKNKDWNFPSVFSPFWRLYYNSKPGHCVSLSETFYEILPDHIMLIPDRQFFHCLGANPVPTFWMAFSTELSISPFQPVPILVKLTKTELLLIQDIQKLILEDTDYTPTDAIYRHGLALLNVVIAKSDIRWKKNPPKILNEILSYIEHHYADRLSNSMLAKMACMSIEGLSKMFRSHIGTPPATYITHIRVKQASHLLLHSNETIDWIALSTGFPNRNYFSRVFKKITNESPAEFRLRHKIK